MEPRRNALLAEMARDASLERSDFLVRAGEQLERFMNDQANRIREIGGLTLIDDDPDYLAIAPDGTFRSRSRVFDDARAEWISETEVIETAAELVEIYNPADVLQAFAEANRDDVWEAGAPPEGESEGGAADPYAEAADSWAAGQPAVREAHDEKSAAVSLYELALDFQERSQRAESGLIEQFENAAASLLGELGTLVIVDDDDEHLQLGVGGFRGKVIPEGETGWQDIAGADEIVRYYDPTDVFGDLAEALVEAYPAVSDEVAALEAADRAGEDVDGAEADDGDEPDGDEPDGDEPDGDEPGADAKP